MLSNAYFLAKFRFDTAENEPAKNLQKFDKIKNLLILMIFSAEQPRPALPHGGPVGEALIVLDLQQWHPPSAFSLGTETDRKLGLTIPRPPLQNSINN